MQATRIVERGYMRKAFWFSRYTFAAVLDPIVDRHGGRVTSWDRTREENDRVGGNKYSFHLVGLAKDVVITDKKQRFLETCAEVGLEAIDEGDHIHVEMDLKSMLRHVVDTRAHL